MIPKQRPAVQLMKVLTINQLDGKNIAFHQKFPCQVERLSGYLRAFDEFGNDKEALALALNHGRNFVDGFRGWSIHCLLIDEGSRALSPFARRLLQYDPSFVSVQTRWLLHSTLSLTNGFWRWLFGSFAPTSISFTLDDLMEKARTQGMPVRDTYRAHLNAILGSYMRDDSFGPLGVFKKVKSEFSLLNYECPPLIAAWVLFHYVRGVSPNSSEVNLNEIDNLKDGPLTGLFRSPEGVLEALMRLQDRKVITLRRYAQPYTVAVDITSEDELWPAIYG